jgi:predicted ester cyclase
LKIGACDLSRSGVGSLPWGGDRAFEGVSMRLIAMLIAGLIAALAPAAGHAAEGDAEVVRAFYDRVLSAAAAPDLSQRAAAILADDWRSFGNNGNAADVATFVRNVQGVGRIIPDLHWEVVEMIAAGDRYIVRGRATGTPAQAFLGVAPSGHAFDIMSIDIHTVRDGRIVRSYHVEDWAGAVRQLRAQ